MLGILHPTTLSPGALVDIDPVSGRVLFDLMLLVHVAFALVGFSAIALTALNAQRLRKLGAGTGSQEGADPPSTVELDRVRQFFKPGPNLAARSIYVVGVVGVALLAMSGHPAWLSRPWLLGGSALWAVCVVTCEAVLWPAERTVQKRLAMPRPGALSGSERVARRIVVSAVAVDVAYVAAFVLMVAQPR